jgi:hypothetical protein
MLILPLGKIRRKMLLKIPSFLMAQIKFYLPSFINCLLVKSIPTNSAKVLDSEPVALQKVAHTTL